MADEELRHPVTNQTVSEVARELLNEARVDRRRTPELQDLTHHQIARWTALLLARHAPLLRSRQFYEAVAACLIEA